MARPPSTRASDHDVARHVERLRAIAARYATTETALAAIRTERAQAARSAHQVGLTWREIAGLLDLPAAQHAERLARP